MELGKLNTLEECQLKYMSKRFFSCIEENYHITIGQDHYLYCTWSSQHIEQHPRQKILLGTSGPDPDIGETLE